MKRKIETIIIFITILLVLISIFAFSEEVIESVIFSISIWKNQLFPSLFPFLIFSYLFINYGVSDVISELTKPFLSNLLHINESCNFVIILSLFSGFPASSKIIKEAYLKDEITKEEMEYLLSFCFFSNPLFIIGTIGILLLGNQKLGFLILFSHYLSNFIIAVVTRPKKKRKSKVNIRTAFYRMKEKVIASKTLGEVLKKSVMDAINVLLLLLGIITIFIIASNILFSIVNTTSLYKGIFTGILEMTSGIQRISATEIDLKLKLAIITSFLSFGGISIHMQILAILDDISINYKRFLISRILSVILSVIIIYLVC